MTEQELYHFRTLLEDKRASIMRDIGLISERSMNVTAADSSGGLIYSDHMPDMGSDSMEREKAFYFASRNEVYLTQVEAALERIKDGTFGVCRECGQAIAPARMEAVPTTTICVPCKQRLSESGQERKSA